MITIQNEGKRFEEAFKKSMPDNCWLYRLRDNAASFSGGINTRFTSDNICDYIMFDDDSRTLFLLELKSTKHKSLTFWREDFEDKNKKQTFMIRKKQILGLQEAEKHMLVAGLIINFRECKNRTFFIDIDDFINYTSHIDKKSINYDDVLQMEHIEIENKKLRTNYRYNITKFCKEGRL